MNLEAFLQEAGQAGAVESQGAFTASLEQMVDRLGASLLLEQSLAPLVAVAAAVGVGARWLDMGVAKGELVFRFAMDEPALGNDGGWERFQSGSPRHLLLAAAVWRKQASQVTLDFPVQGRRLILTPKALRFTSQPPADGPVVLKVAAKAPSSQALELLMLRQCGLCSVPLSLQGKPLQTPLDHAEGTRWSAGVPPHLCPEKGHGLPTELGLWITPTKQLRPPWVAVVGGVSYPFLLPQVPGVRGIVWSQQLKTNLSMTGVVWDKAWTEIRSELTAVALAGKACTRNLSD